MPKRTGRALQGVIVAATVVLAWTAAAAAAAEPVSPAEPVVAEDALAQCLPQKGVKKRDLDEFCLLREERIGPLHIGLGEKEAIAAIPCPVSRGKETFLEATDDYGQKLSFPACGVELDVVSSGKGEAKSVTAIVISQPSQLATSRGIRVGSSEEEVLEAYQPFLDRSATRRGKTIVAGSIYGGLIISIAQGKVSEIFLGAVAE
ncbi:MAG: hypothetical protein U1E66_11470 [Rhodospirillales bacterium]